MDKSKLLEGLKKIKEAFQTVQKFVDAKLNDGTTIIRYEGDMLSVGMSVTVITDQGEMAIPDGDYTLENGTVFSIANGVVATVTEAEIEAEQEATAPESKPATMNETETKAQAKSIIESIIKESRFLTEEEFSSKKENFASKKSVDDLESELKETKQTIKDMFELIEKIADEPSSLPVEKTKPFSVSEFRKSFKEDLLKIEDKL